MPVPLVRVLANRGVSRTAYRAWRNVSMKHKSLFTFGDCDQYEVIETQCVACHGELMFIEETDTLSLPICLVCENALKACERELDLNEEE